MIMAILVRTIGVFSQFIQVRVVTAAIQSKKEPTTLPEAAVSSQRILPPIRGTEPHQKHHKSDYYENSRYFRSDWGVSKSGHFTPYATNIQVSSRWRVACTTGPRGCMWLRHSFTMYRLGLKTIFISEVGNKRKMGEVNPFYSKKWQIVITLCYITWWWETLDHH